MMKDKVFSYIEKSVDGIIELESLLSSIQAIAPESGGQGSLKNPLPSKLGSKAMGSPI